MVCCVLRLERACGSGWQLWVATLVPKKSSEPTIGNNPQIDIT